MSFGPLGVVIGIGNVLETSYRRPAINLVISWQSRIMTSPNFK